jgi:tetratricopeptide (TPR) repeat protein
VSISRLERLNRELQAAVNEGNLELALAVTEDMVEMDSDSSRHHTSRGVVLAKLDRTVEAIDELDTALDLDPEDGRAWYSKGCILMDAGKSRPALACFYKTLDLEPENIRARDRFLKTLSMMQERPEIEDVSSEIMMEDPSGRVGQEEETFSESGKASWKDMIEDEAEPEVEEVSIPAVERPPLPDEEPEIFADSGKDSLLDSDLFDEDDETEGFEEWEGDEEEEEWTEEDDEEWEDDDDGEPVGIIKCRCGSDIPIYSDKRPYRFECPKCSRTGTLK